MAKFQAIPKEKTILLRILPQIAIFLMATASLSGCTLMGANKPAALQITSTPQASVFLNDKHVGKTPFFSDQLKAQEYTVKLSAENISFVEKVDLNEGTLTVINRDLSANFATQAGETLWLQKDKTGVFISTTPESADVNVDGRFKGLSPILVNDLEEGDHKVQVSKSGFTVREFSIKTSSKHRLVADVTLSSEAAKAVNSNRETGSSEVDQIEILPTPQGFLRVRKEPSLGSTEIGRVNSGEKVEIIQETEDWQKIIFEGKQGWVSSQYTKAVR